MSAVRSAVLLAILFPLFAFAANAPVIVSLDPQTAVAGTATTLTLTVNGANFTTNSLVRLDGTLKTTTFVSSTKLTAKLVSTDLSTAHVANVTVAAGSLTSSAVPFTVLPNDPQISSIDPSTVSAGGPDFTLRVVGQNFASTAQVRLNGSARQTTFIDDKTLDAHITSTDIFAVRQVDITVANPQNHISPAVKMTIVRGPAGPPEISTISPNQITANSPSTTITLVGRNFDRLAVVRMDSVVQGSTFVDSGHITTTIPDTYIRVPKTISFTVTNPDNNTSAPATLTVISDKLPVLDNISPTFVRAGSTATLLTANGKNFTSASVIRLNGSAVTTNFVSNSRLTTTLQPAQIGTPRQYNVTVFTAGTDGGESQPQVFTVTDQTAPIITSLNPPSFQVGATQRTFLINGSGFTDTDKVYVGGALRNSTFIGSTQISATLDAGDVTTAQDVNVTVRKQTGIDSAPFVLHITAAAIPVIDSFNPTTATLGDPSQTLIVIGRNFVTGSIITVDGSARDTVFVSATQLNTTLTAADLATQRSLSIVVVTPSGVTSAPEDLSVVVVAPTIDTLDPGTVAAGDNGVTLTISGQNYGSSAQIAVNGVQHPTIYFSATGTLSTTLSAADLAAPGSLSITVVDRNTASAAKTLQVLRPAITSIDPGAIAAGSADTVITVTGTSFISTSKVTFKGGERPTTFVSPTTLTATIPASALGETGDFAVNVRNTDQAISTPVILSIISPGTPHIDLLSPGSVTTGTPTVDVRIFGLNFVQGSTVRVNGIARDTRYVSGTELGITLSGVDLATSRNLTIVVADPTGNLSNSMSFAVVPPGGAPAKRRSVGH